MSNEFGIATETLGLGVTALWQLTVNAARAAFISEDEREALIAEVIDPGYSALSAEESSNPPVQ
jgi:adenosine deaminase